MMCRSEEFDQSDPPTFVRCQQQLNSAPQTYLLLPATDKVIHSPTNSCQLKLLLHGVHIIRFRKIVQQKYSHHNCFRNTNSIYQQLIQKIAYCHNAQLEC